MTEGWDDRSQARTVPSLRKGRKSCMFATWASSATTMSGKMPCAAREGKAVSTAARTKLLRNRVIAGMHSSREGPAPATTTGLSVDSADKFRALGVVDQVLSELAQIQIGGDEFIDVVDVT